MRNVWEVLVVTMAVVLAGFLLMPVTTGGRGEGRRKTCNNNLGQIVKACTTYQEPNGDFFPAHHQYAGAVSARPGSDAFLPMPMPSLAILYPTYIDSVKVFGCPATADKPFVISTVLGLSRHVAFGPPKFGGPVMVGTNNATMYDFAPEIGPGGGAVATEVKCSYLYDPLSHPLIVGPGQAMAADADGFAWMMTTPAGEHPPYPAGYTRRPRKPNHDGGQNVMYFDGHVKFMETNYASDDAADNIFSPQPGWGADTDAYLWDGANGRAAGP